MHDHTHPPAPTGLEPLLRRLFDDLQLLQQSLVAASAPAPRKLDPRIVQAVADMELRVREYIVLRCDDRGLSRERIAEIMDISPHTADQYCRIAYRIFQVHCAAALVRCAIRYGVVPVW